MLRSCLLLSSLMLMACVGDGLVRAEPDAASPPPVQEDAGAPDVAVEAQADAPPTVLAARPLAPLSTATATSQRPTFRWQLAQGRDGAQVEICKDRACTKVEQSFFAKGDRGAPPQPLAAGVHFWRLDGKSVVWELFVGRRSAPLDRSWGSVPDWNGDGLADVVVCGENQQACDLYLGNAARLEGSARVSIANPEPAMKERFFVAANAGDVNGDGYADLAVGAPCLSRPCAAGAGRVHVYFGGPSGIAAKPSQTLPTPDDPASAFATSLSSAGDLDGDGYADMIVGSYLFGGLREGRAYIYFGGPNGLSTKPGTILNGEQMATHQAFGSAVAEAGDVDGDGYTDIVVGASDAGRAYLFYGGPGGPSDATRVKLDAPPDFTMLGYAVSHVPGDLDGDGRADLVVGALRAPRANDADGPGRALVFMGGSRADILVADATLAPEGSDKQFAATVSFTGDVDGDGFDDLLVGTMIGDTTYFYRGGGVPQSYTRYYGQSLGFGFGKVRGAGDIDGDGYADILVASRFSARVHAFFGGSVVITDQTPRRTLAGAGNTDYLEPVFVRLTPRRRDAFPRSRATEGA